MGYEDPEELRAPLALRIFGKVIKWAFIVFVVLMIGWLTVRGVYQNGTRRMKRYLFTEEARERYQNGESLTIYKLTDFNDNSLDRIFYIGNIRYTEELGQFQFMLRFNKNSVGLKEDGLGEGNGFLFVLEDDVGNRYTEYQYITDSALMYRYYRIVFSHIDVSAATKLTVSVYRDTGGEVKAGSEIDRCTVWYSDGARAPHKLSGSEKKAAKSDAGLLSASVTLTRGGDESREPEETRAPDDETETGETEINETAADETGAAGTEFSEAATGGVEADEDDIF